MLEEDVFGAFITSTSPLPRSYDIPNQPSQLVRVLCGDIESPEAWRSLDMPTDFDPESTEPIELHDITVTFNPHREEV
jgi:hypothetical protein